MSLSLSGISFRYPGAMEDLLNDVTFSVEPGESVALMAPSGRGKTTLLGIAGLLLVPQGGQVRIGGTPRTTKDAPSLLGTTVGWILQTVNLLPRRSLIDNVVLPALASGVGLSEADRRARDLLTAVGLDPDDNRQARTLSGGESQRAGVARALMTEPVVLLADEPTANLDGHTADQVAQALFEAAKGTALLVTTHDERVGEMADRIIRINGDGGLTCGS